MSAEGPFSTDAVLSYYRWYSNDFGDAPSEDSMLVEISNDGGSNWTTLEEVGPVGNETSGGWFKKHFRISDFVTPTDQMRVRFTAADLGDASIIEAGVDGVEITLLNCAVEVLVDDFDVTSGWFSEGNVEDLDVSDDQRVKLAWSRRNTSVSIEVEATSPTQNPACFEFTVESRVTRAIRNSDQIIELFNYDIGGFEIVDIGPTSGRNDETVVVQPEGNLARFVENESGLIKAKVTHTRPDREFRKKREFTSEFDKIIWRIVE
jgi:hypothetical protein